MKSIGIIAAMEEELALFKEEMEIKVTKSVVGTEFYIGNYAGKSIVAVKCGIGKVNAAICTQALIDLFAVDCVINTGVAGGVYKEVEVGDIVISTEAVQHDFDCTAFGGYQLGQIPRMETSMFKSDPELIECAEKAAEQIGVNIEHKIFKGRIASGDIFVASTEKTKELSDNFSCYCVEMEGAAIAHTCYLNKVPFVAIRAISDNADHTGHTDYKEFVHLAAKNSSHLVENMIEHIE